MRAEPSPTLSSRGWLKSSCMAPDTPLARWTAAWYVDQVSLMTPERETAIKAGLFSKLAESAGRMAKGAIPRDDVFAGQIGGGRLARDMARRAERKAARRRKLGIDR